jgi:hypothetical protein
MIYTDVLEHLYRVWRESNVHATVLHTTLSLDRARNAMQILQVKSQRGSLSHDGD